MNQGRVDYLHSLIAETTEDPFLHYALGLEYVNQQPQKAKEYFEYVFLKFPDYVPNYYQLGTLLAETGAKQQAISVFEKGIEIAENLNDRHALAELKSAHQNLIFNED
jgi:tetratricopeptide (TPR) repeat protein